MATEYPYTYTAEDVELTGASEEGRPGAPNDPVTITVTEIGYRFKVVLPAIERYLGDLVFGISAEGDVVVKGNVRCGEITSSVTPIVWNKGTRRITPPADFTISFSLPGPADRDFVLSKLCPTGVLKVAVLKRSISGSNDDQPESSA